MADLASTTVLQRAAPAVTETVRPGLSFRVEQGVGVAKLRIYGNNADARFQAVAGVAAPAACTQVDEQGFTFAWLAPGEWLATGPEAAVAAWVERIAALDAEDVLAIDFSHARVIFVLEGTDARSALAAHCPLDLWSESFPVNAAARSLLGDSGMFIARIADAGDAPRFRIIVDQTMAGYAGRLFARA